MKTNIDVLRGCSAEDLKSRQRVVYICVSPKFSKAIPLMSTFSCSPSKGPKDRILLGVSDELLASSFLFKHSISSYSIQRLPALP
jgi:hypothetical protein